MCPSGYEEDLLTLDCIDTGTAPARQSTTHDQVDYNCCDINGICRCETGLPLDYVYGIAGISTVFIIVVMIIVFISVYVKRRKTAAKRANIYVEAAEEFDKLNGSTSRDKSFCLQENNSNSQVMNKISKVLAVKAEESRNTAFSELHKGNAENCVPENNVGAEQTDDHSFPLPATELGATVLVTTKTIQVARENSKCRSNGEVLRAVSHNQVQV